MATPGHEIGTQVVHVHAHMGNGLTSVNDSKGSHVTRPVHDRTHGIDRSQDVRLVHDRDDRRRLVDDGHLLHVQATVLGQANPAQLRPGLGAQLLPRNQIRVVLHLGHHHRALRCQHQTRIDYPSLRGFGRSVTEGVRREIEAFRRVLGEDDVFRARTDKACDGCPRAFVRICCFFCQLVSAPVNRRVGRLVKGPLCVEYGRGLLAGRGAIEIDQRPIPTHGPFQDGKVLTEPGDVQHG